MVWVALCVVPVLIWMLLPDNPRIAGVCHDDGSYVILGRSLVERGEYRNAFYPDPVVTAKYPPGVPVLVAACLLITPDLDTALSAMRIVNALFLALALLAFFRILEHQGLARAGPALIFAVGWSSTTLDFVRVCMSEVPYLAITLVTIHRLLLCVDAEERPWRHALVLGGLCYAGFALRSFGIVLLLAIGLHLLLARRSKTALRFAAVVLPPVIAQQVFMSIVSTPAKGFEDVTVYGLPYTKIFLDSLDWVFLTIWTNGLQVVLWSMQQVAPSAIYLPLTHAAGLAGLWACALVVFTLIGCGVHAELHTAIAGPRIRPWHLLVLGTVGLILPWPADVHRFLIPIQPFLLLMLVHGVAKFFGAGSVRWTALALCALSLGQSVPTRFTQTPDRMAFAGGSYNVERLLEFAAVFRDHTRSEESFVACTAESTFGAHQNIRGVWGWSITAEEHRYRNPYSPEEFELGLSKWQWVQREIFAARILHLKLTRSGRLRNAQSMMEEQYGAKDPYRRGDDREPLLREFEKDAERIREQYRRLGVTHAILLLEDGNMLYDALLARLVRRLVEEKRAELIPGISTNTYQVFRIRP